MINFGNYIKYVVASLGRLNFILSGTILNAIYIVPKLTWLTIDYSGLLFLNIKHDLCTGISQIIANT